MQTSAEKLNAENEKVDRLWQSYKLTKDSETKNQLLLHYTHLVKQIVRRMLPRYSSYNEYDDLVNCGIIGLIDAVEKFDLDHGVKFETYAVSRIRGEILDFIREQDWAPSSLRKKINAITSVYEAYEGEHGEPPGEQEIADRLSLPVGEVRKVLAKNHAFNLVYFEDTPLPGYSLGDLVSSGEEELPENILLKDEIKKILTGIIEDLPEKEKLVISLYYYEELMLKEIADILGVSESRVSQIHSKVLLKMRAKLQKVI